MDAARAKLGMGVLAGLLAWTGCAHDAATTPEGEAASLERVDRIRRSLAEYSAGSYRNFAEDATDPEAFHGAERTARLRRLRETWDPQRVIHANHVL